MTSSTMVKLNPEIVHIFAMLNSEFLEKVNLMPRILKSVSRILILGCLVCGCSSQSQQLPTNAPTVELISLTSVILNSDEINTSDVLNVNNSQEISDRGDCLPMDCAISVWDVLQQEPTAFTASNSILQLVISLRSYQTPENANSSAEKIIRESGGQPGIRIIRIPVKTLPEQSWAYAEDGRFVSLISVYENIQIGISISEQTWGINEPEKAVAFLAKLAEMQIDKLMLSKKGK